MVDKIEQQLCVSAAYLYGRPGETYSDEGVATMAEQSSCNLTSFAKTGG
jgi:hypothetical protein